MPAPPEIARRFLPLPDYEILQLDDKYLPAALNLNDHLRRITSSCVGPKDECEALTARHKQDPRCTALVSVVTATKAEQGIPHFDELQVVPGGACYPGTLSGKVVNRGYGGDFSFLPTQDPRTCLQSATFCRQGSKNSLSSVYKVLVCVLEVKQPPVTSAVDIEC